MSDNDLLDLLEESVMSGNRRTTALLLRTFLTQLIGSKQNIDGKNAVDGYLGMDDDGNADVTKIKQLTPSNYVLLDNGTWARQGIVPLFESYADVGNISLVESDLTDDAVPALTLSDDGDKLVAEYGGTFAGHVSATRKLKLYFGATTIFDSGAFSTASAVSWSLKVTMIRVDSSKVRTILNFQYGTTVATTCDEKSGLTLLAPMDLTLTGTAAAAGAASNDIVMKLHMVNVIKKAD